MIDAIQTQIANVTTLVLVTASTLVTREIAVPQHLSPLSPLSLLLVFTIHARDKGLEMTDVTSDSGDTGDSHPGGTSKVGRSRGGNRCHKTTRNSASFEDPGKRMQKRKRGAQLGNRNALKHGRNSTPEKLARRAACLEAAAKRRESERAWAKTLPKTDYAAICDAIQASKATKH
jgi:hypothetical protein